MWYACWLSFFFAFVTFCSCKGTDTLSSRVSNVAHPDRKCNSPVIRQYMQSLYQSVLPARGEIKKNKKKLILSRQYCVIRAHEQKSSTTLPPLPLLRAAHMLQRSQQPLIWDFFLITAAGDGEAGGPAGGKIGRRAGGWAGGGGARRKWRKSRCCRADKMLMIDSSQF